MAMFRPPKTKKETLYYGVAALGASLLFGGTMVKLLDHYLEWINLAASSFEDIVQFNITVHGLVGATSWGLFGAIASLRDKFAADPIGTVKEIKNDIL